MIDVCRPCVNTLHTLMFLALMVLFPTMSLGQEQVSTMPAHASAKSYGSGWECDRGYHAEGAACVPVKVPANGYFVGAASNLAWKCERGFKATDKACLAVVLPENAHLDYSGNDWECDRPYRKKRDSCI